MIAAEQLAQHFHLLHLIDSGRFAEAFTALMRYEEAPQQKQTVYYVALSLDQALKLLVTRELVRMLDARNQTPVRYALQMAFALNTELNRTRDLLITSYNRYVLNRLQWLLTVLSWLVNHQTLPVE